MTDQREQAQARLPLGVTLLCVASLGLPVAGLYYAGDSFGEFGSVLWLTALLPAFVLSYRSGWRGAILSLALGMGALTVAQLLLTGTGRDIPETTMAVVAAYAAISIAIGGFAEMLHRARDTVETMAYTDGLTGLPNRRHAQLFLENECAAAIRGRVLTIVLFDLDHFKVYNDRYGHAAGDEALRVFGEVLARTTRRMNLSARLGGEEFLSVLAGSDPEGAMVFAERVRLALRGESLEGRPITVSAGVATFHPEMRSADELLAAADHALYQAKKDGRDRIRLFGQGQVEIDLTDETPTVGQMVDGPPQPPSEASGTPNLQLVGDGLGRGRSALVVEFDERTRTELVRELRHHEFEVEVATDADDGVVLLSKAFDVVMAGYPLPSAKGHSLVHAVKARWPTTQVLVVTHREDPPTVVDAIRAGADAVLKRPFAATQLRAELGNALRRRDRETSALLEAHLLARDGQVNRASHLQIKEGLSGLLEAAETHDPHTRGHGRRTASIAKALGGRLGMAPLKLGDLELGALLHDLGKISVPPEILSRERELDRAERDRMERHVGAGRGVVEPMLSSEDTLAAIAWHHEHWDGTGYPDGLAGEAIPLSARITAIADALSAMTQERAYRPALEWDEAVATIRAGFGTRFDPALAETFDEAEPELRALCSETVER